MQFDTKKLLELDIRALRSYLQEPFLNQGLIVTTCDEGIDIEAIYENGQLQKELSYLTAISGIPSKIHQQISKRVLLRISAPQDVLTNLNLGLMKDHSPVISSLKEMVGSYLHLKETKFLKEKKLFARVQDDWTQSLDLITYGFHLPEHSELLYSTEQFKLDSVVQLLEQLKKKKRFGKTNSEFVRLQPYKSEGYFLEVRI